MFPLNKTDIMFFGPLRRVILIPLYQCTVVFTDVDMYTLTEFKLYVCVLTALICITFICESF